MDTFRELTTAGLVLPALLVAAGMAMFLYAPYRKTVSPEELRQARPIVRYLASRKWDRFGGLFIAAGGILILFLRLS